MALMSDAGLCACGREDHEYDPEQGRWVCRSCGMYVWAEGSPEDGAFDPANEDEDCTCGTDTPCEVHAELCDYFEPDGTCYSGSTTYDDSRGRFICDDCGRPSYPYGDPRDGGLPSDEDDDAGGPDA